MLMRCGTERTTQQTTRTPAQRIEEPLPRRRQLGGRQHVVRHVVRGVRAQAGVQALRCLRGLFRRAHERLRLDALSVRSGDGVGGPVQTQQALFRDDGAHDVVGPVPEPVEKHGLVDVLDPDGADGALVAQVAQEEVRARERVQRRVVLLHRQVRLAGDGLALGALGPATTPR